MTEKGGGVPGDLGGLEGRIGHDFRDRSRLEEALRHASVARTGAPSYERLEFLGDRVLGLVVADLLLRRFPAEAEGDLARRHAELVRKERVAAVAEDLGLGSYVAMTDGEIASGSRENAAILCDVCEAVIGALYLDGGFDAAARLVARHWAPLIEESRTPPRDAKTALQEWSQARGLGLPVYLETGRDGPDHAPVFTVMVSLGPTLTAVAMGGSKRQAEAGAAEALLADIARGRR